MRRIRMYGLPVIVMLAVLAVWLQRAPVTDLVVRRYFAANGISAQARTARVDSDRLVFDDVRLGPAVAPDLIARRVTIDLGWSRLTPAVRSVRFEGATLQMRAGQGGVSFGSLDRLIPPGRSTRFPMLRLVVESAIVRIRTPAGNLVWRVDGDGRLDRDFRALARLEPAALRLPDCSGTIEAAKVVLTTRKTMFDATGSGSVQGIFCHGVRVSRLDLQATTAIPLSLTGLKTTAVLTLASTRWQALHSGITTISAVASGSLGALIGTWQLHGVDLGTSRDHVAAFAGSGTAAQHSSGLTLSGSAAATGVVSNSAATSLPDPAGWPTLAAQLADRLRQATRAVSVQARFSAELGNSPAVRVTAASATSATGLQAKFVGPGLDWTAAATTVDGSFELAGGGMPTVHGAIVSRAGISTGSFTVAPWQHGGDALTVSVGRFSIAQRKLSLEGDVLLSSTVAGTRIQALSFPVAVNADPATGAIAVGDGCAPVTLGHAIFGTIVAGPLALTMCPAVPGPLVRLSGGQLIGDVVLSGLTARGSAGGQQVTIAARPLQLMLRGKLTAPVLSTPAAALTATIGPWRGGATIAGSVAYIDHGWTGSGVLRGVDAAGPALTLHDGTARWQLSRGASTVTGAEAIILDPAPMPAFVPLRLGEFTAQLQADRVTAHGTIGLATGAAAADPPLATVAGSFDLGERSGRVTLDSALLFSPALQPLQISELARGIVADVTGKITSHADLVITPAGLTGTGRVRLGGVSLATAALGPVTGIDGQIAFDDVLKLHTLPHQTLHIGAVDPGIAVEAVVAEFQLLGTGSVAVERLSWPFTGGIMTVQPTLIRTGATRRTFTVLVDGLDAEAFLQRFELKNLNATGRFDGVLPLIFDGTTGRIEGGVLKARSTGGLLQYVGDVGQGSMGAAGRLAFDALRKLRYKTLTLRLDGDLDGELVTGIDFTGTNELPIRPAGKLPLRAAGLPFKFGVTVRAPFRALLGTAASFSDARTVIRVAKPAP